VKYRRLALAEPDNAKAAILNQIADEAERDVLCTVDKMGSGLQRSYRQSSRAPIPAASTQWLR
jgi:hypothetical protein